MIGWSTAALVNLFLRFNPCPAVAVGDSFEENSRVPIILDPYEQWGSILCVAVELGWAYVCVCASEKLQNFVRARWYPHLSSKKFSFPVVRCYLYYVI